MSRADGAGTPRERPAAFDESPATVVGAENMIGGFAGMLLGSVALQLVYPGEVFQERWFMIAGTIVAALLVNIGLRDLGVRTGVRVCAALALVAALVAVIVWTGWVNP